MEKERLEEIRQSLREENISYGELVELEALKEHIDPQRHRVTSSTWRGRIRLGFCFRFRTS